MKPTNLALFDDQIGCMGPLTDLRLTGNLRTGMLTTAQRLSRTLKSPIRALRVPASLEGIAREQYPDCSINQLPASDDAWLLVNAAAAAPVLHLAIAALEPGQGIVDANDHLIAASVSASQAMAWFNQPAHQVPAGVKVEQCNAARLIRRPWDIHAQLDATLRDDLHHCDIPAYSRPDPGVTVLGGEPVKAAPSARIHPMVVINAEKGPVVIDDHAVIGSFAVIAGPCYIGKETMIAPHSHVRALCSIGSGCVIGGEVSAIIVQGHSNKAHSGYLGNSIVGEWVNLGADTNASNLKNTYGSVRMKLTADGPAENSGLTKLGPVIGDFVRTAIGTRLLTGSCIGTGAMLAVSGFAPKYVERFAFMTDERCELHAFDKFVHTANQMMERRQLHITQALEVRIRELMQEVST